MSTSSRYQVPLMILTGMLVTLVTVGLARLAFGLVLPFMRADLGLGYHAAGSLGTASALGYLCFVMPAGALAARRGGRVAVLLGITITTIGFVGMSFFTHYALLLAFMLLLGIGTAFSFTPVLSLLAARFVEKRGSVIGLINSGIGLGMLAASAMVPYIGVTFGASGWRYTWMIFAVISALVVLAVFLFLPRAAQAPAEAVRARKTSIYGNRQLLIVGLLYAVVGTTYITQATFMYSFALQSGLSTLTAGRLAIMMAILSIFAGPCWGMLADRLGRAQVLKVSVAITLVGTMIPVIWPVLAGFAVHYFIFGCTISGMFASVLAVSVDAVEPHQAPQATSYVTLFFAGGQFVGPALAGFMIEHAGFRATFAVSCLVVAFGVYLSWYLGRFKPYARLDVASLNATVSEER